jgi:hypothetical protein
MLADNVLLSINELFDETTFSGVGAESLVELEDDEKVAWEGRPFLSLVEVYSITNECVKIVKGFIGKDIENFELIRIQDIDVAQNLSERVLRIGDITIFGADASAPPIGPPERSHVPVETVHNEPHSGIQDCGVHPHTGNH